MEKDKAQKDKVQPDDEISSDELEQVNGGLSLNFAKIEVDYKEKINKDFLKTKGSLKH